MYDNMYGKDIFLHLGNLINAQNDIMGELANIISFEDMQRKLMLERLKAVHKYSIRKLNGKDGRWCTYVPADNTAKRKEVKKRTEEELLDWLLDYYGIKSSTSPSFEEWYEKWLAYKRDITSSEATICRHDQHFRKYFLNNENSKLLKKEMKNIDKPLLESECNKLVKDFNLTKKEWVNVATILNGMFSYAKDKEIISKDVMKDVKIHVKFKQVNKKSEKEATFTESELSLLTAFLKEQEAKREDNVPKAILFAIFTGVRVGELVALKWKDVDFAEKTLHVCRSETNEKIIDNDGKWHDRRVISAHTKSNADRGVSLVPQALSLLNDLKPESGECDPEDFIFGSGKNTIIERQCNYVLEKFAEKNNLPVKRMHTCRRTFATILRKYAHADMRDIQKELGHSNIETTERSYVYADFDEEYYSRKVAGFERLAV